jgi:hypothetical protein
MLIEKNFFDNVFNTVMNDPEKTKDHQKERMDLKKNFSRGDLELQPLANEKMGMPKAKYTLTKSDAKLVCQWVKELKMSDGYASNIGQCCDVRKGTMCGNH